ncbi:hypothetical protein [Priestia megaterium]|uniref:hypothetical protein n=1 Tax=Priestia megaterium TaxID=1404 RepID=UPI002E1B3D09|nr:hypothetical protein [Priestia megaterium]
MEGKAKTLAGTAEGMRPPGAQATRRPISRPRKAKPCTEINSGVINGRYELLSSICLSLD